MTESSAPQQQDPDLHDPDLHDPALDDDTAGHLMVRTDESVTPDKDGKDASRRS